VIAIQARTRFRVRTRQRAIFLPVDSGPLLRIEAYGFFL